MPDFPDRIERKIQEKFGERPSALDFIPQSKHTAIRDGSTSTDVTSWIQDGLDSLSTAGGGVLYLPWGVYPVLDITIPDNVVLAGDGLGKTILKRRAALPTGRGVLNYSGSKSGAQDIAIDGGVTTPVPLLYSSLSDPSSSTLIANSSVRIQPGAKDIFLRRVRIFHSGGYAVHVDARTANVSRILIDEPDFHDNRPFLFGPTAGTELYGAWPGGILCQGDGTNYSVRGLNVQNGRFRRSTGNQIWSHLYAFGALHSDFKIQGNTFEDIGRDGVLIGGVSGGDVSGNYFRRIGYICADDTNPGVPRWINGQWAVGLDTAGLSRGVSYRGNSFISCYGAAMDLDGYAEGVVSENVVIVPASGEPEYTEDSIASWAGNYCYGVQTSNSNDLADAAVGVRVTGNRFRNCGLGAVRMYASRRGTVSGNTIEHPASATVAPIILGNIGNGANQRAYGNTVTDNDIYYSPGSVVGVVQEDPNSFPFLSTDINRVYGNRLHGTNTFELYRDANSGTSTRQEFAASKATLSVESKNWIQREDRYLRGYYTEGATTKSVFSVLDRVSLSGGGFGGSLLNVSADGVGGVVATAARTTSAFDDAMLTSKVYADGFVAIAATTFSATEANLLPDTVGLLRYNSTSKIFEQSTSVSAGARVWTALAGSSLSGLTAGRVPYATGASSISDTANLAWDNTNRVLTVAGATGTAGIVAATSYIQAQEGFYTPSTSSAAIGAPSGGVTALSLISVRNDGASGLTLARTTTTARSYGLAIDSSGNLLLRDETSSATRLSVSTAGLFTFGSSVSIDQAGNLSASAVVSAAGVNVSGTAYNSLQVPSGGLYAGLGATLDQALYVKTFAGTPNNPGAGYGGWSHRSGSTYLFWNGSAWTTVDLTTVGAGVTSIAGTTNQVVASSATGAVTLSLPQSIHPGASVQFTNLGLGVSPLVRLDVRGSSASVDATLQITGTGVSSLLLGQDADGGVLRGQGGNSTIKFRVGGVGDVAAATGGTEAMRINSSANVLINNATDDTSGAKLQITGFVRSTVGFATPSTATDAIQATTGGVTARFLIGTRSLTMTGDSAANAGLSSTGQGRLYFDSTSNKFRVSEHGGAYVDLLSASGVTSITGTANQVIASAATGAVTLSLPQNIHLGATPTFLGSNLGTATIGDHATLSGSRQDFSGFSYGGAIVGGASGSTFYSLCLGGGNRASGQYSSFLSFHGFGPNANLNGSLGARISAVCDTSTSTDYGNHLDFETVKSASVSGTASGVRMRITSYGNVLVATTTDDSSGAKLQITGFARATTGFATPGTATDAIQATSGGVTARFLVGTRSLTMTAETAANAGLSSAGQGRVYFDSTSNKLRVSENGNAYVDLLSASGVASIAGTANQVIASAATGAVTLSLPQSIHTGAAPTFAGLALAGTCAITAASTNVGFTVNDGSIGGVMVASGAGGLVVGTTTSHPLILYTNNIARITISPTTGLVTIGSTVSIDQSGNFTASAIVQAGGVNAIAGSPAYNTMQTNGGVYAVGGATLDQAVYLKTFAGTPNSPAAGYGALSHRSGATYLYWNGSAWATVDLSVAGGGVTSIAGTANQVIASAATGAVTLSLPQSIHTGATPTFAGVVATVFNSTATGSTIGFQLNNSNFLVNGNGVVSTAGGYNAGGLNVIDASQNFYAATLQTTGAAAIGSTDLTAAQLFVRVNGVGGLRIHNSGASSPSAGAGIQAAIEVAPASGDRLAFYAFGVRSGGSNYNGANFTAFATQAWTLGSAQGTELRFETTPNGAASRSVRMTIGQSGLVTIGSTVSIDQSGNITATAVVAAAGLSASGSATNSIQCASGGVTAKYLIGTTSVSVSGDSAANAGLSGAGSGRIYFDSTSNKFRASENGGAYVDLLASSSGVTSITGTANQVIASAATGAVTLSLPQDIHTGATPTFTGLKTSSATFGDHATLSGSRQDFSGFSYGGTIIGGSSAGTFYSLSIGGGNRTSGQAVGSLSFHGFGPNAGLNSSLSARMWAIADTSTSTDYGCHLDFETVKSASVSGTASGVRMRITSYGNVLVATTTDDSSGAKFQVSGFISTSGGYFTPVSSYEALKATSGGVSVRSLHASVYSQLGSGSAAPTATSGSSISAGAAYWDTTAGAMQVYNGSAWVSLATGGGVTSINSQTGPAVSIAAGTAISVSAGSNTITVTNTGVTALTGTTNRVTVSASTGSVTLSLPQDIHTAASPTFAAVTAGAFSATATGASIGFQTSNFNFQVDGNGNISGAGSANMTAGYRVGGTTVIDSSRNASGLASATASGVFQSQATGSSISFQNTNFNFQVNGNGVVSCAGGYNVGGSNVINSSGVFVGASGINVGSAGITCGAINPTGGYTGQTWSIVGTFTISGVSYTTLIFRGGVLVSAS